MRIRYAWPPFQHHTRCRRHRSHRHAARRHRGRRSARAHQTPVPTMRQSTDTPSPSTPRAFKIVHMSVSALSLVPSTLYLITYMCEYIGARSVTKYNSKALTRKPYRVLCGTYCDRVCKLVNGMSHVPRPHHTPALPIEPLCPLALPPSLTALSPGHPRSPPAPTTPSRPTSLPPSSPVPISTHLVSTAQQQA